MTAQAVESRTVEELVSEIEEICQKPGGRPEILPKVGGVRDYFYLIGAMGLPEETVDVLLQDVGNLLERVQEHIADERPAISNYASECAKIAFECIVKLYEDARSAYGQIRSTEDTLRVANDMLERARERFARANFSEAQRLAQEALYRR